MTGWGQGHFILKDNGLEYNVDNSLGAAIVGVEENGMLNEVVNDKRQSANFNAFMARGLEGTDSETSLGLTSEVFKPNIKNIMNK